MVFSALVLPLQFVDMPGVVVTCLDKEMQHPQPTYFLTALVVPFRGHGWPDGDPTCIRSHSMKSSYSRQPVERAQPDQAALPVVLTGMC